MKLARCAGSNHRDSGGLNAMPAYRPTIDSGSSRHEMVSPLLPMFAAESKLAETSVPSVGRLKFLMIARHLRQHVRDR